MSVIRWEEPPRFEAYSTRQDWPGIAATLMRRPGKWAVVAVMGKLANASVAADRVKKGVITAMRPQGSFDACARTVDGEVRLYARYVGSGDES